MYTNRIPSGRLKIKHYLIRFSITISRMEIYEMFKKRF